MTPRRALFLDRDGVINVDHGYVHRLDEFDWQDGIFPIARAATAAGLALVVVTNQSGIGRGMYSEAEFAALTAWMCDEFARQGAAIARVYHCPFHPNAAKAEHREDTRGWRKPKPGMILQARDDLALDLAGSTMIGDRWGDAEAAWAAGVGRMILVGDPSGPAPIDPGRALRFPTVRAAADWFVAEVVR